MLRTDVIYPPSTLVAVAVELKLIPAILQLSAGESRAPRPTRTRNPPDRLACTELFTPSLFLCSFTFFDLCTFLLLREEGV